MRRRRPTLIAAVPVVVGCMIPIVGVHRAAGAEPPGVVPAAVAPSGNPKVPGAVGCCGATFLRPGDRLVSDGDEYTLYGGGLGAGSRRFMMTTSGYRLTLQSDGNLVERQDTSTGTRVVWSAGTAGAATVREPAVLAFQTDGNVVLRDRTGRAVWASGTAGRAAAWFDVYGNGQIVTQDASGRVLSAAGPAEVALPGIVVTRATAPEAYTANGPFHEVTVQADGNVVEYDLAGGTMRAVWSTGTSGVGQARLVAQSDGNLVLRQFTTGRAVWSSGSRGPTGYYQLDMQDDDNLVLYRTDGVRRLQAVWSTGIRH